MPQKLFSLLLTALLVSACNGVNEGKRSDNRALVERVMAAERVPGMAVGIWRDGETVLLQGYGVTNVDRPRPVNGQTLFKLASTSKAFTAAALALLVDEGRLAWESRVVDILPSFALADPWITREFRIEDLLTHRSGLGPGAGDLMLWPQPNHFSREDIIAGMRHLPIPGRFRADYAYDNLLYIVAGEVIEAVSGQPYEAFVEQRLLRKMGLQQCYAGPVPESARGNLADPHIVQGGKLVVDSANLAGDRPLVSAAAGGMHCSVEDMLRWLQVQLAGGVTPEGERVFSLEARNRMWRPVTLMPLSEMRARRDRSHFYAYALGWRVQDMYGYRVIHHTGSLSGMYAWVALVPEKNLALAVLMNRSSPAARQAMIYSLLMPYLGAPERDWLADFTQPPNAPEEKLPVVAAPQSESKVGAAELAGFYRDSWFGRVQVEAGNGGLRLQSLKSPRLSGRLQGAGPGVWQVRWDDRTLHADAWLVARNEANGGIAFRLEPLSPDIDFSYDFQDLDFRKEPGPSPE